MKTCDRCKQDKPRTSLEPTQSQLLFGGFPVRMENRCDACEREVIGWVTQQLKIRR